MKYPHPPFSLRLTVDLPHRGEVGVIDEHGRSNLATVFTSP